MRLRTKWKEGAVLRRPGGHHPFACVAPLAKRTSELSENGAAAKRVTACDLSSRLREPASVEFPQSALEKRKRARFLGPAPFLLFGVIFSVYGAYVKAALVLATGLQLASYAFRTTVPSVPACITVAGLNTKVVGDGGDDCR